MSNTTTNHVEVANTILTQLGGGRFMAMTGASNPVAEDEGLGGVSFRLPSTPHFVKDKINHVQIILDPSDTYRVVFGRVWGMKYKAISKHEGIYCDMLRELFEEKTGLATSL